MLIKASHTKIDSLGEAKLDEDSREKQVCSNVIIGEISLFLYVPFLLIFLGQTTHIPQQVRVFFILLSIKQSKLIYALIVQQIKPMFFYNILY